MKLIVKNMVCPRCIMSVRDILKGHKIEAISIKLGEIELRKKISIQQLERLSVDLQMVGFELLDDQKSQLIEQIKSFLIQKVQSGNIEEHFSIQKFLSRNIFKDYSSLSKLFSEVEGITIEQFFILQKIEKIKEWLIYNELSLSQVAFNLGYSSSQHLSNQFKKMTGMTPSQFKNIGAENRKAIDHVSEYTRN